MPGPDDNREEPEEQRDADSVRSLEAGGLPVTAVRRIREAEKTGGTWASDLSVAEHSAIRSVGFEPLGLVLGGSVYHIGFQWGSSYWSGLGGSGNSWSFPCRHGYYHEGQRTGWNWEHTVFEAGITTARNLAMSRLVAEATALGAHGVVGLRVEMTRPPGAAGNVDFLAVGTAVRHRGSPPLPQPFTCHLSGQDFAKLMRIGLVPAAFVLGVAAIEVDPGCGMEFQEASFVNQELSQPTHALQACREIAVAHLEHETAGCGEGVVGVEVSHSEHHLGGGSHIYELQATGTAVRRFAKVPLPDPPLAMLRLGGGVK